jgi:pSer/pThr/pTyr-binding forkhead associated (FHA) protein
MVAIAFLVLRILIAAALYVFLGLALWQLWRQLSQAARQSAPSIPALTLTLQSGQAEPPFRTHKPELFIGRQPGCDLRLAQGAISARHARLSYHNGQWWVEDLQSKNGTFLNEVRLEAPLVIASGDVLRCGGVRLDVQIEGTGLPVDEAAG